MEGISVSPKSLMNKFAKSKTDFWKNEELQRVIGTGTLKVPVQSILNLLFSWADPLLSLCAFQCHTAGCGYRTRCPLPTDACSCSWQRCVCCRGWQDTHCPGAGYHSPRHKDVNLGPYSCTACSVSQLLLAEGPGSSLQP